jgi:IrrE N-terminal-like domain
VTADRPALRQAYLAILEEERVADSFRDVPDPDIFRSLIATQMNITQHLDRQRRESATPPASTDVEDLVLEYWTGPAPKPSAIDENIIRHLALIPYPSWSHVGRDARNVLLHRIATMASRPRAFAGINADRYQRTLDEKEAQIEALIERSGRAVPPAYVGLFPTGSHNAEATGVEGGTLILVNSGLMNLLYRVAKISVASATYASEPALIDDVQTAMALTETLAAHTVGGSSFLARDLPMLDRRRLEIASKLTTLAEVFVIAHEYAHILAGHLDDPGRESTGIGPGAQLMVYRQSQSEEYEADRLALDIIGPGLLMPDSPRGEAVALSAVLMFFFVDLMVWKFLALTGHRRPAPTTHPHSEDRYERARRQLAWIATSRIAFDHAEALALWFRAREPQVIALMSDAMKFAADLEGHREPRA